MRAFRLAIAMMIAGVVLVAGLNYNASKSNTGNIIVTPESVTAAQASAILADLEKSGKTPDEEAVRAAAAKHGVPKGVIKKVIVTGITSGGGSKGYGITLLAEPGDEGVAKAELNKLVEARGAKQSK